MDLQAQIWRSYQRTSQLKDQLWNSIRQCAEASALSAIHRRFFTRLEYHNCNLYKRHSYPGSQKPYRSIQAFTRKPFLHPEMAKKMENQSQWGKICTGDIYHLQKDMPTSNFK